MQNGAYTVDADRRGTAFAALANDRDPSEDALVVVSLTQPLNGTEARAPGSALVYRANHGYIGYDGLSDEIADGKGRMARASVTVFADP